MDKSAHETAKQHKHPTIKDGTALRLFLTCWLIYGLHFATNTVREIYPALSLGDRLSFDVTEYLGLHPDIFEIPGKGAFINNNPGASILGAVPYALARPLIDPVVARINQSRAESGLPPPEYDSIYPLAREFFRRSWERGLDVKFGLAAGVMQLFLMAPLSAATAVLMFAILRRRTGSTRTGLWLALLYAFATPVFYRTAQLNHNLLQAHFAFLAFALLWQPWETNRRQPRYFLAGLLAGWTLVLDYSGVVIVLALGVYALSRWLSDGADWRRDRGLLQFGFGVALSAAILAGYQWASFGSPIYPAQHYMPETTFSGFGYRGLDWPAPDLVWLNAFGAQYGIFTSAPLLVLALYAPGWFGRKDDWPGKAETWLILGLTSALFLFTAANQFSRMQFNSGVRHMVPATPFLFLLAAKVLLQLPRSLAVLIGGFSLFWSWCLAMYRDVEQGRGIFEAVLQITTQGVQLPWLNTLARMGLAPSWLSAWLVLLAAGVALAGLWGIDFQALASRLPGRSPEPASPRPPNR